ncbi:MAG: M1 family aminopeptidase [Bacteroidota bacterium]
MKSCFTSLLLLCTFLSSAQEAAHPKCFHTRPHSHTTAKTTTAHPAEDNYDVKYVKLDLAMTNTSTTLSGEATTRAVVLAAPFTAYVFELSDLLMIDSAFVDGVLLPVSTAGAVRTISLSTPLAAGALFTARVCYHGTPLSGTISAARGINTGFDPLWNANTTFTTSECYDAQHWWPCKQSLRDKIDSSEIWITVADSLKAGSNGLLKAVVPLGGGLVRYEWKETYPIDYYLLSVAVGPYLDYSYYMHFTGSDDSMLVQNYVYTDPAALPGFKPVIDSTALLIDYFSTLFGRYPFWKEKYGHSMAYYGGGMENQTMSTVYTFDTWLMVHELAHQWFGNNVTCGTWADIMMNEGFANYAGYLFEDHFYGHSVAVAGMAGAQNHVKSFNGGTVYVPDTTDEDRIFDGRLTYTKGSCVLHMLRSIVNNDGDFFHIFQQYQERFKDSTATVADFRDVAKDLVGTVVNGIHIDTFFKQWVYLEGFPKYSFQWNQSGSDVYLRIDQSTSMPSSVPLFKLPVEVRLHATTGDTVVRVVNNSASQVYHFTWDKPVASIVPDPEHWLVYKLMVIVHNPQLSLSHPGITALNIKPNPGTNVWLAEGVPGNCRLTLTDMSGRVAWDGTSNGSGNVAIPAGGLAPGCYVLSVWNETERVAYTLVKE